MKRIVISETDEYSGETTVVGHFDLDKAEKFEEDTEWDGNNMVSVHNVGQYGHQMLLRTAGGRWILNSWSQWEGSKDIYGYVSDERARDWLMVNKDYDVIEKYLGEIEEEKGPGRPEVGPPTNLRLGEDLTAKVDAARHEGESRAAAIRRLLTEALA
ncbi:ribbon-helix-helix domain-containing protein [Actinoallomurus purpureus]|uniref:ribbon-helix-helix domain-containing protein n=1 Tax=Actinoallomurus purpureus TaxID=478114 RepID=UPI002092AEE8|nr:CopG family transcriptional regulator [Actinoallomurus purpureus]MCO6011561.1 ribbon-helix-helix domain-containing protein [Actinoallomurus purpureus]